MATRVILKTHTESLRPALYSLLVLKYTDAARVSIPETIVSSISQELRTRGFTGESEERESAIKFAVLIARKHLKLLRTNMTWEWRGFALASTLKRAGKSDLTDAPGFAELSLSERFLYLKYFLEADGALILRFVKEITAAENVTKEYLVDRYAGIVESIFDDYEQLAEGFRERTQLKNRRREAVKQMKGTSLQRATVLHKVVPHLQLLLDLGVLVEGNDGILMSAQFADKAAADPLLKFSTDLRAFENLVLSDGLFSLVADVYGRNISELRVDSQWDLLKQRILQVYDDLKDSTTGMAHMRALIDVCCVSLLAEEQRFVAPRELERGLNLLFEEAPHSVRFHVDFDGRPAYIVIG